MPAPADPEADSAPALPGVRTHRIFRPGNLTATRMRRACTIPPPAWDLHRGRSRTPDTGRPEGGDQVENPDSLAVDYPVHGVDRERNGSNSAPGKEGPPSVGVIRVGTGGGPPAHRCSPSLGGVAPRNHEIAPCSQYSSVLHAQWEYFSPRHRGRGRHPATPADDARTRGFHGHRSHAGPRRRPAVPPKTAQPGHPGRGHAGPRRLAGPRADPGHERRAGPHVDGTLHRAGQGAGAQRRAPTTT